MTASLPTPGLPRRNKAIIYIDGFNLYYGALKGTAFKWLDLDRFFRLLRPADDIQVIKYFSALVTGPKRLDQETYLRALATLPNLEVIVGKFKNKRFQCTNGACSHAGDRFFEAKEEKRTDVNIAVAMVDDAYQNRCDHFILISGDSDLVPAISVIRSRFPAKKITVYVPHIPSPTNTRGFAVELRTAAHTNRDLPLNILSKAQFPSTIQDGFGGTICKPRSW
jgi:6-hydroxy-3-succinoylpyridine 3-monooxygenase